MIIDAPKVGAWRGIDIVFQEKGLIKNPARGSDLKQIVKDMARGRKAGGRQKGSRNSATVDARAAAEATGILPLD